MPNIEAEALRYLGLIYDAALDRGEWPCLLETLAASVKGNSAMLRQINPQTRNIAFYESTGYEEQYASAYREHFCHLDPYQSFCKNTAIGDLIDTEEKLEARKRRASEYFNDFELPQDKIYAIGGVLHRDGGNEIQFGIQRGQHSGNFRAHDRRLLQLLLPHVARAIGMQCLLEASEYRQNLAFAALDQLRLGIFLHDAGGRLFYCNREAEALLATNRIAVRAGGLALHHEGDTARLRKLMTAAAKGIGSDMRCHANGSWEGLHVWITPLPRERLPDELSSVAGGTAVFISRPGPLRLPWQRVASHYGLTPAEARLAVALADGKSLEEAAEALNIAYETARSHLKAVFAKTGTRRQPALVAMMLQGVLATCRNEP